MLEAECAHLADQTRAAAHHLVSEAMEGLDVNLLRCPDFNNSHCWPRDGFSDRLGIENVVPLGLDIGLHELCGGRTLWLKAWSLRASHCEPG